ncbi:hypothetical protein P3T76_008296 [Phytophthora citrophthora]|uniref:Uncharacterized protein n=1 Tax=Phytophthora citrophthora TaxID=4793 RepID=A0AAD9GKL4_9STRA|nr:hypothetical protein P3T76_008296 [Phytophthora citrophthora]
MNNDKEGNTDGQTPSPAPPITGRERIGMADDNEEMSTAVTRERGVGTDAGTHALATGAATTEHLVDIIQGLLEQLG